MNFKLLTIPWNPSHSFRIMGLFTFLIGLVACATPHRSYDKERHQHAHQPGDAPMTVIEFDERGDYWDPSQYAVAEQALKSKRVPILVTYVHGWTHDARPDDMDLQSFQLFLNNLNKGLGRQVCGVFIGWRGASVQTRGAAVVVSQPAKWLSFWGRKKITDNVAGVPFSNVLWRLAAKCHEKGGHAILIGHSFGGRIVERTLGPAAIAQMNNEKAMPYDLTFLINPATESLYARQLKLALRNWKSNQPAVVVLAARNDTATGLAWPLALGRPDFTRGRDYVINPEKGTTESQKSYVCTTVGNDQRQITHRVDIGQLVVPSRRNVTANNLLHSHNEGFVVRLRGKRQGDVALCRVEDVTSTDAAHQIKSKAYWVVPLPKEILTEHGGEPSENGIFCDSMSDLMAGIMSQVKAVRGTAPIVPKSNPSETLKSDAPAAGQVTSAAASMAP